MPTLQRSSHGLRKLQFGDGLPQLYCRLRTFWTELCDLCDLHGWLLAVRVVDGLHWLSGQYVHPAQRPVPAVQHGAAGLRDVQFQLGVPVMHHGVRPQRVDLRHVRVLPDGLLDLLLQDGLHGLREHVLRAGGEPVSRVQLRDGGVPHLQLELGVPELHGRVPAQRLQLRALQRLQAQLHALLVEQHLHGLRVHGLRPGQRQLHALRELDDGLPEVQLRLDLHGLHFGVRPVGLLLRDLRDAHRRLLELLLGHDLHGLREHVHGPRQRQLRELWDRPDLLPDVQLQLGVPDLLGRVRRQREHLRRLRVAHRGLLELLLGLDLHGLREHHLHFVEWQLSPVQLAAGGLHHLQLGVVLLQLYHRLRPERVGLCDLRLRADGLQHLQFGLDLHGLLQQQLRPGWRGLQPVQLDPHRLPDMQQQFGVPDLHDGLRAQRDGVRDVRQLPHGLRELFLVLGVHGLRQQLVHAGRRQLHPVQHPAGQLPDLQLQRGVPELHGRLLAERVLVQRVRDAAARLLQLQLEHDVPGLRQQHLHAREQQLHPLQLPARGLRHLLLPLGVPQLLRRVRPQRAGLRHVRLLPGRLRLLLVHHGLHVLRQQLLRAVLGHVLPVQHPPDQLPHLQLQRHVPQLRHGVRPQRGHLRVLRRPHLRLHQLHLRRHLHRLPELLLRPGVGLVPPLQLGPHGLRYVRLGVGVQYLHLRLRHQRDDLRDLQQPHVGLCDVLFQDDLLKLHKRLLHAG